MPKRIDDTVWKVIKSVFLSREHKPTYRELAEEFGISKPSIENKAAAEGWQEERARIDEANGRGRDQAAQDISKASGRRVDPQAALDGAISDLYHESVALEGKSKEGCANAMANLMKTQRELYPPTFPEWVDMVIKFDIKPTPDDLIELAVQAGITPAKFMEALKLRWAQELEPASDPHKARSMNGGKVPPER